MEQKDLLLAILSMDAYNHGYDPALDHEKSVIGSATVALESDSSANSAERRDSFFAISYKIDDDGPDGLQGQTVISYRGTDTDIISNSWYEFFLGVELGTASVGWVPTYHSLKSGDWTSGGINRLIDVIVPDPKTTASVIGNFQQVVKEGALRLHPLVARLVDKETLERMRAARKG